MRGPTVTPTTGMLPKLRIRLKCQPILFSLIPSVFPLSHVIFSDIVMMTPTFHPISIARKESYLGMSSNRAVGLI